MYRIKRVHLPLPQPYMHLSPGAKLRTPIRAAARARLTTERRWRYCTHNAGAAAAVARARVYDRINYRDIYRPVYEPSYTRAVWV